MKRIIAALLLIPSIALCQVTTNPGVTGVVGTGTTGSGSVVLQYSPTLTGTLTAGAISGTTITSSNGGGRFLLTGNTGTNYASAQFINTSGEGYVGLEGSAGGQIFGGTTAYAMVIGSGANKPLHLTSNNAVVATVSSTGLAVTGTITASAIASSGAAQSGYLCYNTTGGVITYDGGATCLVSREEYKTNLGPIKAALPTVMSLRPFWGAYREGTPMQDRRVQPFLGARYTASVDQRLASFDKDGEPLGVRYENMSAVLVAAIQEQQIQIKRLQREVKQLQREQYAGRQPKARQAAYIVH